MGTLIGFAAPGSRLEINGPHGAGRQFRIDLVRGDTHKRVCQGLRTDYGDAILAAGRLETQALPVVDVVADRTAPIFDPKRGR